MTWHIMTSSGISSTRKKAYKGNPSSGNLCRCEKLCILAALGASLLNKQSELLTMGHHKNSSLQPITEHAAPTIHEFSISDLKLKSVFNETPSDNLIVILRIYILLCNFYALSTPRISEANINLHLF